jgi:hypothetical protein
MPIRALAAALLLLTGTAAAEPPRLTIDLGPSAVTAEAEKPIDILAPAQRAGPANPVLVRECENQRDAGIVAGEIVVCGDVVEDSSQFYSGSRDAARKAYAERTQNAGTIPAPDVAGAGIFRGPATMGGMCFVPPCPKGAAVVVDFSALPMPPPDSDADRVAQGLAPREVDGAPIADEARRRIAQDLGLPEPASPAPQAPAPDG